MSICFRPRLYGQGKASDTVSKPRPAPGTPYAGSRLIAHVRAHPRLIVSVVLGLLTAALVPSQHSTVTRGLIGWNLAVWLYLALDGWMMVRADHAGLRRRAALLAESASTVLLVVVLATLVSLIGTVLELSAAKLPGTTRAWPHLLLALATVAGSWLLLPTLFALNYASLYYGGNTEGGLLFPQPDPVADGHGAAPAPAFAPHYDDFLYFSFTIAVACQTSDVAVTRPAMRRLVLLQAVLSFAFNTAVLAFGINLAAGLF